MLAKVKQDNPNLGEDRLKVTAKMKSQAGAPRFDFSGAPGRGQVGAAGANRLGAFDLLRDMEADGAAMPRPPMLHADNILDGNGPYNNHGPMGAGPLLHPGVPQHLPQQQQLLRHAQQEVGDANHPGSACRSADSPANG